MTPPLPPEVPTAFQGTEIALREIANEHNIATMATVSPVGPTPRHMRLTPKAHAPIAPRTTFNPDFRLVVHKEI